MASPAAKIALLLTALSLGIVQCTADKDDFVCGISAEQLKKVLKHGSSQISAATEIKCDIPALKMLLGAKERAEDKIDQQIDFVKKAEKKIEFALQRMQHSKKLRHSANHKTLQHKLETLKNTEKELMRRKSMSASKSPETHMVKEMTGSHHSAVEHKKMPHSKMPAQQSNHFPENKQVFLEKLDNMKNVVNDLEERMHEIESSKDKSSPNNVMSDDDDYNDYSEMSDMDASRSDTIMYDNTEGDYSEEMSLETKMPESSRSNEMSDNSYSDDVSDNWSDEEATDMDYDEELDYSNERKKRSVQKPTDIRSLVQNLLEGLGKSEDDVLKKIVAALNEDDVESKGDSIKKDLLKLLKDFDSSVEDEMPQTRDELHRVVRSLLSSEGDDHENIMGGIIKRRVSRKHHKAAGRRRPSPPPPVQVGGHKDMSRCARCEAMVGEEVCGANGQNYNSLCHAINCGGLSEDDVRIGPCNVEDVCEGVECEDGECVPLTNGVCLTLYAGRKRLPCKQYICVSDRSCSPNAHTHVCGVNGRTYPSLCRLHEAGVQLAYSGGCRPQSCREPVCGRNAVTYQSVCHARTRGIRVDYHGNCFAKSHFPVLHGCADVVQAGRCTIPTCRDPVRPQDSCCPVCGGALVVHPNTKQMSALLSTWTDVNHMYVIENFLRQLLSDQASKYCELSATLTNAGNISVVLESIQSDKYTVCKNSARELAREINGHYPALEDSMLRPITKTARLLGALNPLNSVNAFLEETSNTISNGATNTVNGGLEYANNRAGELETEHNVYISINAAALYSVSISLDIALAVMVMYFVQ